MAEQYTPATGKRKSAIAQVRLVPGQGKIEINGKEFYQVFTRQEHRRQVLQPFVATETMGKFDIKVKVTGGGLTGQAGGIRHGIARALAKFNESYKPLLRAAGFLTRDSRVKERKKYGLKRARKAPQYTKR
ncbi:MAG TPA: 30S ribosomal protein S9 [Dehalococcoidia bacterium]|nr:30S ribosomal protein S9 [Dehalococcoidia bacterium]